ncbi:hypothetical protein BASA81_002108 [Batrachochytrium salamandrivorans]|nr:hypothetical protein BASA81_002108 [Batrachochytrium salamandrivorans]
MSPPSSVSSAEVFPVGTLVFVPDPKHCFVAAQVVVQAFSQGQSGQVEVLKEDGEDEDGEVLHLSPNQSLQCQAMDEQSLSTLDNMVEFRILNEASLLHNLRQRFAQDEIYTSIGDILVSVNPFKMMEDLYTPDTVNRYIKFGSTEPPHVFRVADLAVRRMMEDRVPQSCIVSGESGAGKTEATKVFLQYIAEISLRNAPPVLASTTTMVTSMNEVNLQDRILQANPLLEAFGNAKTKRNDNSSRFGKYIQVNFNSATGTVVGGQMTSYLLEKSRVVFVAEGERNYHIFYQLVAGAAVDKQLRTKYMISNAATDYFYLNQSSCIAMEEINDSRGWQQTSRAMEMIGITESLRKEVFVTLAGILHLGNVAFTPLNNGNGPMASVLEKTSLDSLSFAAQCLGFPTTNLAQSLIKRDVSVRGEKIFKDNTLLQAQMQRDALAKQIYSLLFDWLLVSVNKSLGTSSIGESSSMNSVIGILDIFGFESFQRNSFEQLCINYCNEKLQGHFNSFVFTLEQTQYEAEGLDVSAIQFKDNADTVLLLEAKRIGLFGIMDEEGNTPNASDVSYLKKVHDLKSPLISKPDMNLIRHNPKEYTNVFILTHFAGPVCYNVEGFLEKNKDALAPELHSLLQNTEREFILDLQPEEMTTGDKSKKKTTSLGFKFKTQLDLLMETLQHTKPHFIRCIKPNFEKVPDSFTATMVLSQLRYSGLLEVCRIRQNGYPIQRTFADFIKRYGLLLEEGNVELPRLITALTSLKVLPSTKDWQLGKTKLFFRHSVLTGLERARDDKLCKFAIDLQRTGRGYTARRQYKRYLGLLLELRMGIQLMDETKLENAILNSGSLPYRGVHLKLVQEAHTLLEQLRARSTSLQQLTEAIMAQDLTKLSSALQVANELNLSNHELFLNATTLVGFINQANELKVKLRGAIQARNLEQIQYYSQLAQAHTRPDCTKIDVSEAEMMIERLLYIQTLGQDIAALVQSKGDVKKVMQLVSALKESGGVGNHPLVILGEQYANEQASVSATHAKRVKETKDKILASKDDLLNLIMLEMEAIQLGIDKDGDLLSFWDRKHELETQALIETKLASAAIALQQKDRTATEDQIALYEGILNTITWRDVSGSKSLLDLAHKQLVAKKRLDDLLNAPIKKGGEADIKLAVKEAQALGINSETARKAQALLTLKTIAAEEKKEMRRRSMMPLGNGGGGGLQSMLQLDPFFASTGDMEDSSSKPKKSARPSLRPHRASLKSPSGLGGGKPVIVGKRQGHGMEDQGKARTLQRMAIYQAKATDWNLQCIEFTNKAFKFENFSGFRSNEDFTAIESEVGRKLIMAENKLVHSLQMIPKSLLVLDSDEVNLEALTCFKSILGWSLDANAQFPQTLAVHFIKQGMYNQQLSDELYAQLIKQLRRNPGKESVDRIWLLLCLACESFSPSREFLPCVVNYLMTAQESMEGMSDLVINYAKWCLFQLCATTALSATTGASTTNVVPTVKYISAYMARPPVLLKIHLVYRVHVEVMSTIQIPVWPDQDVGVVERIICELEHFPPHLGKTSGLFLKDLDKPRVVTLPPSVTTSPQKSPNGKLRVDTRAMANAVVSAAPSPLAIKNKIMNFVRTKKPTEDALEERRLSTGSEAMFSSTGRASTVSAKSSDVSSGGGGGRFFQRSNNLLKGKSFRILKSINNGGEDEVEIGSGTEDALLNAYIAVGGSGNAVESSALNEDGSKSNKPAAVSQQVSRVPPPPFAPWPLPRSFFLGDVFARLVSQDRLPFLTFQRKLFVFDTEADEPTYVQILQDVLNNRLPLGDFWQVLQLACVSVIRARMVRRNLQEPPITDVPSLVAAGLYSYIPMTWLSTTSYDWAGIAIEYLRDQGRVLLEMSEQELYGQYLAVCQTQPLFGAALFSVIHKDLTANLVACLNAHGLHVLTNEASPVGLGILGYAEMQRFGASSTSVWVEVTPACGLRLPDLVAKEDDDNNQRFVLHLHTQQAREIYQLLTDYSYWFHHGFVKD